MCKIRNSVVARLGKNRIRIDPCMRELIENIYYLNGDSPSWKTLACCCGHGVYPMTVVVKIVDTGNILEIFSDTYLNRTKRFYVTDKNGLMYIPEVKKP